MAPWSLPKISKASLGILSRLIGRVPGWAGALWVVGIGFALVVGSVLSWWFWEELHDNQKSLSETVRNLSLVIGGVVAVLLAVWRSRVAERQAKAAQSQAKASQQSLLNEHYQKGAEMHGSDVLSVRLGGVYALRSLTDDHPEQYHLQVMRLLCAFARNPIKDDTIETESLETQPRKRLREDVQAVIEAIGLRSETALDFERKEAAKLHPWARPADREKQFRQLLLQLDGANLSEGVYLEKLNLSGASLSGADLSGSAFIEGVDLSSTALFETNLSGVQFGLAEVEFSGAFLKETNLSEATLQTDFSVFMDFTNSTDFDAEDDEVRPYAAAEGVNLSSACIHGGKGLAQHQLDSGCFWANPPPTGINRCAKTGEILVWPEKPRLAPTW
ncbi:MAG: pentapeptide repeat-containing protein [Chloroflexi bacterium]|nr:pentapeptide repeat-containing protein [Chloroflexota bacterium]